VKIHESRIISAWAIGAVVDRHKAMNLLNSIANELLPLLVFIFDLI